MDRKLKTSENIIRRLISGLQMLTVNICRLLYFIVIHRGPAFSYICLSVYLSCKVSK